MALTVWELARIAELVYEADERTSFDGGLVKRNEFSTYTYYAAVFEKKGNVVLAFRGTDQIGDFATGNIQNFLTGLSLQSVQAINTYRKAWQDTAGKERQNFYITGHSLGGALTTIVSLIADNNIRSVTFCAPGVGAAVLGSGLAGMAMKYAASRALADNVVNICVTGDIVSRIPGLTGQKLWLNPEYKDRHSIKNLAALIKKSAKINVDIETFVKDYSSIKKEIAK